jgi:hypothetical protein
MNTSEHKPARLPRCLHKFELANYFGITTKTLWATILTEELLDSWGLDQQEIKPKRVFGPSLSRRIYEHYHITDLDADFSEEVRSSLREKGAFVAVSRP